MRTNLCEAARREIGNYGRAYTAAAVLKQEQRDLVEARQIGAVDDGATLPLSLYQARVCEHGQVGRHGVLWNFYQARQRQPNGKEKFRRPFIRSSQTP